MCPQTVPEGPYRMLIVFSCANFWNLIGLFRFILLIRFIISLPGKSFIPRMYVTVFCLLIFTADSCSVFTVPLLIYYFKCSVVTPS